MATIINTLEVVLEPPRAGAAPASPPAAGAPAPATQSPLTPADLADVAERRARYMARITAH